MSNSETIRKCVDRLQQGWGGAATPEPDFNKICEIWEVDPIEAREELDRRNQQKQTKV